MCSVCTLHLFLIPPCVGLQDLLISLNRVRAAWPAWITLAELFVRVAGAFEAYAVYVSNFNTAIGTLSRLRTESRSIDSAIATCERQSSCDFSLNELLSFPLNRVAEYAVTFESLALAAQDARSALGPIE